MSKTLVGKNILVTRARSQSGVFAEALEKLGATVISIPTIQIIANRSIELDRAIQSLDLYDWLLFTSVNGVKIFFERLKEVTQGKAGRMPRICSIGPATSLEIRSFGYEASLQPSLFQAEGIIDELSELYETDLSGLRILLPRAREARKILPERLRELGAEVDVIPVYDTRLPSESAELLNQVLSEIRLDLITFTSSSTVRNLVSLVSDPKTLSCYDCAVIGPITAETAKEYGLRVVLQPTDSTIPDFVQEIESYLTSSEGS